MTLLKCLFFESTNLLSFRCWLAISNDFIFVPARLYEAVIEVHTYQLSEGLNVIVVLNRELQFHICCWLLNTFHMSACIYRNAFSTAIHWPRCCEIAHFSPGIVYLLNKDVEQTPKNQCIISEAAVRKWIFSDIQRGRDARGNVSLVNQISVNIMR